MTKLINIFIVLAVVLLPACNQTPNPKSGVKFGNFNKVIDGKRVSLWVLKNHNGIEMTVTNFGARVVSIMTPDRDGEFLDIALGHATIEEYEALTAPYYGAAIGRYGNRIAKGKFALDGIDYRLATNNNENHLHGGPKGFHAVVWDVDYADDQKMELSYLSKDGEEGYPGNLKIKMTYELTNKDEFKIEYFAETDKKTVINLTHHTFFNLHGEGSGPINDHILFINADNYTPTDAGLIPTGEIAPVVGTPMDFTTPTAIGKRVNDDFEALKLGKGYDHNFVLNKRDAKISLAAKVVDPSSGRILEVYTDEPAIQFYGGNFQDGTNVGKNGKPHEFRGAFCLETQHSPDSPNQEGFPSVILSPGEIYRHTCIYKFGVEK